MSKKQKSSQSSKSMQNSTASSKSSNSTQSSTASSKSNSKSSSKSNTKSSSKSSSKSKATMPMNTFQQIPMPNGNAQQVVALVKKSGKITGYKLSNGQVLSREQGVKLARQGGISGVGISTNQGTQYLKSLPDSKQRNNLSDLPTVQQ